MVLKDLQAARRNVEGAALFSWTLLLIEQVDRMTLLDQQVSTKKTHRTCSIHNDIDYLFHLVFDKNEKKKKDGCGKLTGRTLIDKSRISNPDPSGVVCGYAQVGVPVFTYPELSWLLYREMTPPSGDELTAQV